MQSADVRTEGAGERRVSRRPPPGCRIAGRVVRVKSPEADLKAQYPKVFSISVAISCVLHIVVAVAFPTFRFRTPTVRKHPAVILMEDIPETRQVNRPALLRPVVPIEVEGADVPEDVTTGFAEVGLGRIAVHITPPSSAALTATPLEKEAREGIYNIRFVERKPELLKEVKPEYPRAAREAGLEGVVLVEFTVGKDGRVKDAMVMEGHELFRKPSLEALSGFRFNPGRQNERFVEVRMFIFMRFQLNSRF